MSYDYGKCHVCGSDVEEKPIEHTLHEGDEWILIRHVPTGVCVKCGEQILRWQVSERLEEIIRQRHQRQPDLRIQIPVFAFPAA